ncbi:hypothetical protein [Bradyrhizobium lablabi]|uniref:hypothetical protein n=1 Tax=Bradyrhizobium lablabi TaxID=722472 RepID=UPI0012E39D07|nr:hypothetical protein [Bradyrhizobium lablabi]
MTLQIAGIARAKAPRVNRVWLALNGQKAVSGNADTAFLAEKSGIFAGWRFTAR